MKLFHDLVDLSAQARAEHAAIRYRGEDQSFAALSEQSCYSSAGLQRLGVQKGDRVAIYLGNRPELIEIALACSRIGAIFIPLSPLLKARQLTHVLTDSGASVLVTAHSLLHHALQSTKNCVQLRAIILADSVTLPRPVYEVLPFVPITEVRTPSSCATACKIDEQDPAAILYTSGSTGRSKGVVLSHRNLVCGASIVAGYLGNTSDDRILAALPLSFDYGLSQVTSAFYAGACAVLTNFSLPVGLIQEVVAERITGLAGVPTMWSHLANSEWPEAVTTQVRYVTNSGGALTPTVIRQLRSRLPSTKIYCMYGLTEAFRSTYLDPQRLDTHLGSIGKAIPTQEIFVVRPDGSPCDANEIGELVHRGSLVTLGYWNDRVATAQRFRPFRSPISGDTQMAVWSGDLVRADENGFLYFVGRGDALIKTSGYRVSPLEIEEAVSEVEGVIECAALGLPDDMLGQKVALAIVSAVPEEILLEQVRRHCRMHLPAYMVPAEFHLVAELPRNTNGKVDRAALATTLASLSASESSADHTRGGAFG